MIFNPLHLWSIAGLIALVGKYQDSGQLVAQNDKYEELWERDNSWTCLSDFLLALFFLITTSLLASGLLSLNGITSTTTADGFVASTMAYVVTSLVVTVISWMMIFYRGERSADPAGVITLWWKTDLRLGVIAFLTIGGIIYCLQGLLTQALEIDAEHPIMRILAEERTWRTVGATSLSAVVVAPIFEEYLFRFLFQGWLESVFAQARGKRQMGLETFSYATTKAPKTTERQFEPVPIVCTSAVFALMHFSHGASFITLFFFSLALGYLFQRTRRLLPSIILHFMLNLTSMIALLSS